MCAHVFLVGVFNIRTIPGDFWAVTDTPWAQVPLCPGEDHQVNGCASVTAQFLFALAHITVVRACDKKWEMYYKHTPPL